MGNCIGDTQHVIIPSVTKFYTSIVRRSSRAKERVPTSGIQQIKWCYLAYLGPFVHSQNGRDQLVLDP